MAAKRADQEDQAEVLAYWLRLLAPELPAARREYRFNQPATQHRFDFCWVESRLAAEVDGGQHMVRYNSRGQAMAGGRHNTDGDRVKGNLAAIRGYRVLHFSTDMLRDDPGGCVDTVRAALGR